MGKRTYKKDNKHEFELEFVRDEKGHWSTPTITVNYGCQTTPAIPKVLEKTVKLHCTTENSGHKDMEGTLELSTDGLKAVKSDAGYTLALTVAEKDYSKFDETVKAWDKDHERTTKDTFTLTYVYNKESGKWVNNDEIVINYACKNGGGQTGGEETPAIPKHLEKQLNFTVQQKFRPQRYGRHT